MTLDEFRKSTEAPDAATPPALSEALHALWCDAHGDWDRAHELAQSDRTPAGSWVHAYLHRKEGDLGNAGYWYTRAGRPAAEGPEEAKWNAIAEELLRKR